MTKVISILNQKGGVGKTTLAVNLAFAFKAQGNRVLLIDSDPQGSARDWHAANEGELLEVVGLDRPTLDKDIHKFKKDYDFIFIDGAPHLSMMAARAIICSDLILVPVQPSPYDIWASKDIVDLIKQRQEITEGKLKAVFVISRAIPNTVLSREVREAVLEYGLPVLENGTYQRVLYSTTAAVGRSVYGDTESKASHDIELLVEEIKNVITESKKETPRRSEEPTSTETP